MRRPCPPLLLFTLLLLGAGCRTGKKAPLETLAWLRGATILVVAEEGVSGAPSRREAAVTRALTTVPVRAWPGDADPTLLARLDDPEAGETRLARAREAAEARRIPWLVVTGEQRVRVENARGGEIRWESKAQPSQPPAAAAAALREAIGRLPDAEEEVIVPESVRIAPLERIVIARSLAVAGDWTSHAREAEALRQEWPADPAVLVHGALPELLGDEPSAAAEAMLRRSMQLNPDGESELLAIALAAEAEDRVAVALRAREGLVRLYPARVDYRPELADLHGELGASDRAVRVLRGGLATTGDRDAIESLPSGTAPHDAPAALPYADLRFSLGWYLAQEGDPEGALLSYEKALEVYDALGRPREQSDAVNNAGVVLVEAGRPAVAVPLFRKARRLRTEQGRPAKAANSAHNLARALAESRRVPEAIETYEAAARDYEAVGDPVAAVESLYETMEHHAGAGDTEALEHRADELLKRLGVLEEAGGLSSKHAVLRGAIWFERGRGRMTLRDPKGALEAYTVALDLYRQLGSRLDEAQTLYSMAVPNMALFRLEDAYDNLVAALELAVELNDSASIVDIREQIGELAELIRSTGRTPPPLPESVAPFME